MTTCISNTDDTIDSRDVIKRIGELQEERQALVDALNTLEEAHATDSEEYSEAESALNDWDTSGESRELAALLALQEEAEGYSSDWQYGAQLIRDSYFQDYAEELADDIGAIDRNATWPRNCIDWEQAARELKMDYTAVDFDGVTYWVL